MPVEKSLHLRACPRCRGAMHASHDMYGNYSHCLACGHTVYPQQKQKIITTADIWDAGVAAGGNPTLHQQYGHIGGKLGHKGGRPKKVVS